MISKKTYQCPVIAEVTHINTDMLCVSLAPNPTSGLGDNSPGNGGTSEGEVNAGSKGRFNTCDDEDLLILDDGKDVVFISNDIW